MMSPTLLTRQRPARRETVVIICELGQVKRWSFAGSCVRRSFVTVVRAGGSVGLRFTSH